MNFFDKLFNLDSFQRQYNNILVISVADTIKWLQWITDRNDLKKDIDWNNMLSISSILADSDKNQHLDAALRIAQSVLQEQNTSQIQRTAAIIVLEKLTNKPAIDLALKRDLLKREYVQDIPLLQRIEIKKSHIDHTIYINDKEVRLNKFQKLVQEAYSTNQMISISAPTSSWKSFILTQLILEELSNKRDNSINIVYLVPTRALISQVEADLRREIKEQWFDDIEISSVPQLDKLDGNHVFVFTQERLHRLLTDFPLRIDILIIDEAQKIDDSNRGILLQQKIEEVIELNPFVKIYFSSPFTTNPETLLEFWDETLKKNIVNTSFVAVNQNLIYLKQVFNKPLQYDIFLSLPNKEINLWKIFIADRVTTNIKKFSTLSFTMSKNNDGNLIYANWAAEAEKLSAQLSDLIKTEKLLTEKNKIEYDNNNLNDNDNKELKDFIWLVKKTIHKSYLLWVVLEERIAFHYGNMPLLIREEIERLFRKGIIKYLVCTSTLLEWVNLPTKSIFIMNPRRGKNTPLSHNDFRNLAWRAWRLGKEFSGNIICINPEKWEIQPNPIKEKQIIEKAVDIIKLKKSKKLLEYIEDWTPRKNLNSNNDLEFAFWYFYIKFLEWKELWNSEFENRLKDIFSQLKTQISIPLECLKRNPWISPIAQQSLYNYFDKNIDTIENLIPPNIEDGFAYEKYWNLIEIIGTILWSYPIPLKNVYAILLIDWMSWKPLSYIIKKDVIIMKIIKRKKQLLL